MPVKIDPIPELPEGLRAAAQAGRLVPFVGAGVSMLAGCPGWGEMARAALAQMVVAGKLSYAELEQCQKIASPRVRLSIAELIAEEHGLSISFSEILEPNNWHTNSTGLQCYGALGKLGRRFVTTNYDRWLDYQFPYVPGTPAAAGPARSPSYNARTVYDDPRDFTAARFQESDTVIHLHGSLRNPIGMIKTMGDYVLHYANDRGGSGEEENRVLTFLDHLFSSKTVLFVGYGLEEMDILEHIVQKARAQQREAGEVRHYMLQPYFSYELALVENMARYYRDECGIVLLPYLRDGKDWEQLVDVLVEYARQIPAQNSMVMQELNEMEGFI